MKWNNIDLPEKNIYFEDDDSIIYCADCRDILPLIPDKSIDLVLTDPPYGINFTRYILYKDDPLAYDTLMKYTIRQYSRIMASDSFAFVWQAMKRCGEWANWFPVGYRIFAGLRNFTQYLPTTIQYSWDPIIFWQHGKGKGQAGNRDYHIGNTAKYVAETSSGHPCPRPKDTVAYIMSIASEPSNLVLDPFLGSGTTAYCAKKLGRKCIGIEIEEKYCKIAVDRLRQSVMRLE